MKKILVDMSATLIHNGHIRLLKKASLHGKVVVALTTDAEIIKFKGYAPELTYKQRKEILESISYVDEVIPSPWLITNNFLCKNKIHFLVHGNDNTNLASPSKTLIFKRTKGISSSLLRRRVITSIFQKLLFRFKNFIQRTVI